MGKRTHGLIVAVAFVAFGMSFGMQCFHAKLERTEHALKCPQTHLVLALEEAARENSILDNDAERASVRPSVVGNGPVVSVDLGHVFETDPGDHDTVVVTDVERG